MDTAGDVNPCRAMIMAWVRMKPGTTAANSRGRARGAPTVSAPAPSGGAARSARPRRRPTAICAVARHQRGDNRVQARLLGRTELAVDVEALVGVLVDAVVLALAGDVLDVDRVRQADRFVARRVAALRSVLVVGVAADGV